MAIGKIERWPDYLAFSSLAGSGAYIDQSDMDSLDTLMPAVYFHLDPESFNVDYGYRWSTDTKGSGNKFVPPDEGEPAEPTDLMIPHVQKSSTGIAIKGLTLRFDDLVRPNVGGSALDTEQCLRSLHNMALPFDDPRSVLKVTRHYEVKTSIVHVFYVREGKEVLQFKRGQGVDPRTVPAGVVWENPPERDPETGEIKDKGRVRYWIRQIDKFQNTARSQNPTKVDEDIEKVIGKLAPHPLLLNLGWPMANFVCIITKLDHTITRVARDGKVLAATVVLDLEQYDQQTLQQVNPKTQQESDVDTPSQTVKSLFFVRDEKESGDQRRIDITERPVTFAAVGNIQSNLYGGK